jgi:serine/threonine protein kinase
VKRATVNLALKLAANMLRAESVHGEPVILKLTDQHEVEVLRRLHGNQPRKQTHIIPLLHVVDERLIVLPLRTPLLHFLDLDATVGDVELLALQFLEGVVYLQHSAVAHLDLKPDNIVVQWDPKSKKVDLTIIDFNIAVFADIEPIISASSGTAGWCAPEVSAGKPYNPLLADRWSCGRVLAFFMERMKPSRLREPMHLFSQRLMDPNPSLRPPVPDPAMGGMLDHSIRTPVLGPGDAPRPRHGKPRSSRSSRRLKGLGPQVWLSSPVVVK